MLIAIGLIDQIRLNTIVHGGYIMILLSACAVQYNAITVK